ncbi:HD superfamily hydrolase [Bdellovibrio bacteriovorus W]|nr:HD superfamily hydrolase [Bdellovibrio bacteriovorus W]
MEMAIAAILGLFLGGIIVFVIKRLQDQNKKKSASVEAERIINRAKSEAAKLKKESENRAKDFESRARKNVETDIHKQKSTLKNKESQLERRLKEIDDQVKQKLEENDRYLNTLKDRENKIVIAENRIQDLEKKNEIQIQELRLKLESVAAMSQDEARRQLLEALEDEAKQEASKKIAHIESEAQREAEKNSKRILATALARFASEYTSERTVSVLALPSDEMKGKIIGREGRNIRTLEALCGVDLIVDDTPEAVVISGFDPVRRELARRTIEKLMEDGRVHPARIEEVVEKQRGELLKSMKEEGESVVMELGIANMHPELVKIIGGLKYRSYQGQNALNQALEVANIAGLLAAEMGFNVKLAKRAGLLHNIGKAIDHTVEGSYALVGAEAAKKYNESEDVCHAIRAHDEEEKPHSILAWIVHAAFILSSSRPGARRPQIDTFIHRLEDLESIGNSFDGVLKTLALQAGKDVRVIVESSKITDDHAVMLSRDIARKIEREVPQAGQVKVTVVRETRSVEHAR